MKKKTKTILSILAIVVVLFFAGRFAGLFSVTAGTPPTCVFTDTVKTCTYNYSIDSERAASVLTFDFDGGAVPGTALLGTQVLQSTSTYSFNDPSTSGSIAHNTYYMYAVPSSWSAYDVVVNMKGTDSCVATSYTGNSINIYNSISAVTAPWASSTIVSLSSNSAPLTPEQNAVANFHYDTNKYSTPNIYTNNQAVLGGLQTRRCYKGQSGSNPPSESGTTNYDFDTVIPNTYVYGSGLTKFIVRIDPDWTGSGGSVNVAVPTVTASYHESFYPSNVAYKIGNLPVQTFPGQLLSNATVTSLDISDQINLYCNRGFNSSACTVPITITSATPGNLWVSKHTETLKVSSQGAVITQLQGTLSQQIEYINTLNATIQQKAALIEQLTTKANEQGVIIDQLNVTINEKAQLIAQLGKTASDQVVMIQALNATIEDQATVINSLTQNLAEKAYYVSQLQVENQKQADLVKAMQESFTNQGEILSHLNKTVTEDAQFINQLTTDNTKQAQIIAGLQTSVDTEKAIAAQLEAKVADQQALLAKINDEKAALATQNKQLTNVALIGIVLGVVAVIAAVIYVRRKR